MTTWSADLYFCGFYCKNILCKKKIMIIIQKKVVISMTLCIYVHCTLFSIQNIFVAKNTSKWLLYFFKWCMYFLCIFHVFFSVELYSYIVHSCRLIHMIEPWWPGPRKKYNPQGVVFFPRTGHLGSIHIVLSTLSSYCFG